MSSQVNKNKALAESVVSETYPATVLYNSFFFFASGTWVVKFYTIVLTTLITVSRSASFNSG